MASRPNASARVAVRWIAVLALVAACGGRDGGTEVTRATLGASPPTALDPGVTLGVTDEVTADVPRRPAYDPEHGVAPPAAGVAPVPRQPEVPWALRHDRRLRLQEAGSDRRRGRDVRWGDERRDGEDSDADSDTDGARRRRGRGG